VAIYKLTTKFLYSNAGYGPGSWTENWYYDGDIGIGTEKLKTLNAWRLKVSANAVTILSQVAIDLSQPGVSFPLGTGTWPLPFPTPSADQDADVPQMALAFKLRAANGSKRTFLMKAVPDNLVKNGRYFPAGNYLYLMQNYVNALSQAGFSLRVVDKSNIPQSVVSISSTGAVLMESDQTWMPGAKVSLYRALDANKQGVVGTFPIVTRTDARNFQLGQWGSNPAVVKGKLRLQLFSYPVIVAVGTQPKATVGKIGSPSGPYVGRRTKRR